MERRGYGWSTRATKRDIGKKKKKGTDEKATNHRSGKHLDIRENSANETEKSPTLAVTEKAVREGSKTAVPNKNLRQKRGWVGKADRERTQGGERKASKEVLENVTNRDAGRAGQEEGEAIKLRKETARQKERLLQGTFR